MDLETYGNAVIRLIGVARDCTGGSRVAAQVLLSAYNGASYQLSVSDLGVLDHDNYQAALAVIRGRQELNYEPHQLIKNGSQIFEELRNKWWRLHVKHRGKQTCPDCSGEGEVPSDWGAWDRGEMADMTVCSRCDGLGLLEE